MLASIIAASTGLAIHWSQTGAISILDAILTISGVMLLHASVDLLNDYWDFKRKIDTNTKRTKLSGGTGVLPEKLLEPKTVYKAGIISLILGGAIGLYFVISHGVIILAILGFAIVSIYFYSTKIVDFGMAEVFVAIKGMMIVMGTFFIQSEQITTEIILAGGIIGVLSSLVLFVASFPDYNADKLGGRKTLVILVGRYNASYLFWIFPGVIYGIISLGVFLEYFSFLSLITLAGIPLVIKSGLGLRKYHSDTDRLVPFMESSLLFSRVVGVLFVISLIW